MRRISSLLLAALLAIPVGARAADEETDSTEDAKPVKKKAGKKKKKKIVVIEEEEEEAAPAPEEPPVVEEPSKPWRPHRYAFIGGGVILAGGLAFAYAAQGEAKRAETIGSAKEAGHALDNARAAAAASNVMYGLAIATLAYAALLEFLPERISNKLTLSFHF
ncbi:MAG: hypothetical protein K1X89_31990 [Myxococcaceae bacterium]|nr:hypothetical protein [Myxococcaceae bacterium]